WYTPHANRLISGAGSWCSLVSTLDCQSRGRGFKSRRARHLIENVRRGVAWRPFRLSANCPCLTQTPVAASLETLRTRFPICTPHEGVWPSTPYEAKNDPAAAVRMGTSVGCIGAIAGRALDVRDHRINFLHQLAKLARRTAPVEVPMWSGACCY